MGETGPDLKNMSYFQNETLFGAPKSFFKLNFRLFEIVHIKIKTNFSAYFIHVFPFYETVASCLWSVP